MKQVYLAFLCLLYPFVLLLAQTQPVRIEGTVTDAEKQPLPGVSVRVKASNTGVATDAKGKFSIAAAPGSTLEITYVGFSKREIKVTSAMTSMSVVMSASASALQETVIIGYQQVTRKKSTAAISSLSG
ncbi:MAG TPA: carboxypeptidase-like regulatory domain-containing protein, partial [Chitinophaga sp.]